MPTCARCHGSWCTELVLSSHSYIPSLESLCLALPSLPVLPAKGRHHFSHGWHCTALPAPPASKNDKNQGDGAGPGKLHCSSTKNSIPWGKQRWVSWRGDATPLYPGWPLPFASPHGVFKAAQQSMPGLGLAPTPVSTQDPARLEWPAPFLWSRCVVPHQAPSVLSLAQQRCSPTN